MTLNCFEKQMERNSRTCTSDWWESVLHWRRQFIRIKALVYATVCLRVSIFGRKRVQCQDGSNARIRRKQLCWCKMLWTSQDFARNLKVRKFPICFAISIICRFKQFFSLPLSNQTSERPFWRWTSYTGSISRVWMIKIRREPKGSLSHRLSAFTKCPPYSWRSGAYLSFFPVVHHHRVAHLVFSIYNLCHRQPRLLKCPHLPRS